MCGVNDLFLLRLLICSFVSLLEAALAKVPCRFLPFYWPPVEKVPHWDRALFKETFLSLSLWDRRKAPFEPYLDRRTRRREMPKSRGGFLKNKL